MGRKHRVIGLSVSIATICCVILLFIFVFSANSFALSYQSSVGVSFTFNPTIVVTLSGDLLVNNLTPGSAADSNVIDVTVATNASQGYNLLTTVGAKGGTSALVNTGNSSFTFTNLTTTASSLNNFGDNKWGYSYSVDNGTNWISGDISNYVSGYSGLPLDDNNDPDERGNGGIALINAINPTNGTTIKFKIGAKASASQAAGTYTNTINFYAVANPEPLSILDLTYMQDFATLSDEDRDSIISNMVTDQIYTLKDSRDQKEYFIAKYSDGNVWMAQNLDLDIDSNTTYTNQNTDIGYNTSTHTYGTASWSPTRSTYTATSTHIQTWCQGGTRDSSTGRCANNNTPESYDSGSLYWSTAESDFNDWITYNSSCSYSNNTQTCNQSLNPLSNYVSASSSISQYRLGNLYNWAAALATNNSSVYSSGSVEQSICPAGWTLPKTGSGDGTFYNLWNQYGFGSSSMSGGNKLWTSPLFLPASGTFDDHFAFVGFVGGFWTSSPVDTYNAGCSYFYVDGNVFPSDSDGRFYGNSVRCIARKTSN